MGCCSLPTTQYISGVWEDNDCLVTCSYDRLVTTMNTHTSSLVPPMLRSKATILDKSLSRGKQEISLAAFALLFSETVQYCQARSSTVPELQGKLHDLGFQVGARILDLMFVRDRAAKRELKLLNALLLVNTFISVPKDKGSLNCAAFVAGIVEAVLDGANFPAKVSAHWHKGTTFMVKFEESVIARDKVPGD